MNKLAVIIPAAGSGSRMGTRIPKPFLELNGSTILEHTIRSFVKLGLVRQVIIATSKDWFSKVEQILGSFSADLDSFFVVEGGLERQHSIYNALQVVSEDIDLVAVHDAVRPFVSDSLINKCAEMAGELGGAIVAVPAKDTIKKVSAEKLIKETPDRSELWQAQTPQIFQKKLLVSAYKSAQEEKFVGTDDASLVERIGGRVGVVEGDRRNLKITYPIDLKVAEMILNEEELK